jgi:transcriptional regulator with XRE-family HTH domain
VSHHPVSIGARIRSAREKRGINKNQLARLLGTSWQHVHRWEIGRTAPSADSLQKIAKELGVSAGYLLGAEAHDGVGADAEETRGLELFLKSYAPDDLTEAELSWLKAAPLGPDATAGRYVDLLEALRASAERTGATQSGTHVKADREAILRRKQSG